MSKTGETSRVLDTVRVDGFTYEVDVKQRANVRTLQLEMRLNGRRSRVSARTRDLEAAKTAAAEWIRAVARELHGGELGLLKEKTAAGHEITLGDLFTVFRERRLPHLKASYRRMCRKAMAIWEAELGPEFPLKQLGQNELDEHERVRRAGGLVVESTNGTRLALEPVGPSTTRHDVTFLSNILNYLKRVKREDGSYLMERNPLDDLNWPKPPEELKQPAMSDERYAKLLRIADLHEQRVRTHQTVSKHGHVPFGIMRTTLVVARRTGRRVSSIAEMHVGDVLFEERAIRAVLARLGKPVEWAEQWTWGAIYWRKDKKNRLTIIPMGPELSMTLRAYLDRRGPLPADAPLFPSIYDQSTCINTGTMEGWFQRLEEVGPELGIEIEHIAGGLWHQLRRQWRSERTGRFTEKLIAVCGGWLPGRPEGGLSTAMGRYYIPDPGAMFDCMRFDPTMLPPGASRPGVMVELPPDHGPALRLVG